MPVDSNEPPRQDILLKLLKMTTSPNDGEALTAIRKANAVLTAGGWDWDKLISRKIVIVEDPFSKITDPFEHRVPRSNSQPYAPPPRSAPPPPPPPPPRPRTPPPPPPPPKPKTPYSNKPNNYAGWCYCCGDTVPAQDGFVFKPYDENNRAPDKWVTICKTCNKGRVSVPRSSAPRQKPLSATPDLSNL